MIKKNDFAARIKQYCTQKGLSISELEKNVGYSAGMISRWSGTREDFGILTKLVAMADFLELSLDEMVGRGGERQTHHPKIQKLKCSDLCSF